MPKQAKLVGTNTALGLLLALHDIEYYPGIDAEEFSLTKWAPKTIADHFAPAFLSKKVRVLEGGDGKYRVVSSAAELGELTHNMQSIGAVMAMPMSEWRLLQKRLPATLLAA